MDKIG